MSKSTGRAIVGFLFGAAVGVAAGILLAPRKGDETWRKLQANAKNYTDDLGRTVGKKIDDLKGYVGTMANESRRGDVGRMAEETKQEAKKHMP